MTLKEFLKYVPEEILAYMYHMEVITFNDLKAIVVFENTAYNLEFAGQISKATIEFEIYTKYHNKFTPHPAPGVVLIKNTQFMKVKITTQDKTYEYHNNNEFTYEKFLTKYANTLLTFKEIHQHHAVYENKEEGIRMKFEVKYNDFIKAVETVESCSWKSNVSWNPNI